MHYEAKKAIFNDQVVSCVPAFLNQDDVNTNDIFRFIDIMDVLIKDGNTFDFEFFTDAKEHLIIYKHDSVKDFEEYRKFNYYIEKLKWLKLKNIKQYYRDKRNELRKEILDKYPNLKYSILNFEVNESCHREAIGELYKEYILDIFEGIDEYR